MFTQLNLIFEKILLSWLAYNRHKVKELITFIKLIIFIHLITHVIACGWIAIGRMNPDGWVNKMSDDESNTYDIYWMAFFFVLTTITTVGYGAGTGSTRIEYIYCMFNQLLGLTFFSLIMSTITSLFTGDSDFKTLINRRMNMVDNWMNKLEKSNK